MRISPGVDIRDLGLFIEDTLVISDVHIGYEEELNKRGVLVPRLQFRDTVTRLEKLLRLRPRAVVVNGDMKHEFGRISEQEWRETLKILDLLTKSCGRVVLVKGNHDTILGPIAKKRDVDVADHFCINDIYVTHGDKIPDNADFAKAKTVIIGHEHPAVSIREENRTETFKCFLFGRWKDKKLIVQPSFNLVTEGTDVLNDEVLSPFLRHDISRFHAYVVGDRIYDFGLLKHLK
ncbi:MAG: metallophosphoesterase [archaeon]